MNDQINASKKSGNIQSTVPFLLVSEITSSIGFYQDKLGFEIKESWEPSGDIEWCHLKKEGGELMLQQYRSKPLIQTKQGISIYFFCNDALIIYNELIQKQVDASEPFVSNGMWLTTVKDPDGYEINFESFTNVPEGTKLNDWIS